MSLGLDPVGIRDAIYREPGAPIQQVYSYLAKEENRRAPSDLYALRRERAVKDAIGLMWNDAEEWDAYECLRQLITTTAPEEWVPEVTWYGSSLGRKLPRNWFMSAFHLPSPQRAYGGLCWWCHEPVMFHGYREGDFKVRKGLHGCRAFVTRCAVCQGTSRTADNKERICRRCRSMIKRKGNDLWIRWKSKRSEMRSKRDEMLETRRNSRALIQARRDLKRLRQLLRSPEALRSLREELQQQPSLRG